MSSLGMWHQILCLYTKQQSELHIARDSDPVCYKRVALLDQSTGYRNYKHIHMPNNLQNI